MPRWRIARLSCRPFSFPARFRRNSPPLRACIESRNRPSFLPLRPSRGERGRVRRVPLPFSRQLFSESLLFLRTWLGTLNRLGLVGRVAPYSAFRTPHFSNPPPP